MSDRTQALHSICPALAGGHTRLAGPGPMPVDTLERLAFTCPAATANCIAGDNAALHVAGVGLGFGCGTIAGAAPPPPPHAAAASAVSAQMMRPIADFDMRRCCMMFDDSGACGRHGHSGRTGESVLL